MGKYYIKTILISRDHLMGKYYIKTILISRDHLVGKYYVTELEGYIRAVSLYNLCAELW